MALDPIGVIFTAKDLASGSVGRLDKKFKTLSNTTDDTALKFSKNLKLMGAGLAMVAVGAVGLGVLNSAAKNFGVLETAVAEASTLIKGTPKEIEQLTRASQDLANTFGTDSKTQAAAFYQAISAGVGGVTEAQEFLVIANKVAVGGVTDAVTAVDGLTTVVSAFSKDNVTAQEAADGLFVAMKAGKTTIAELSANIAKAAPLTDKLGIKFDELLGATSAVTLGGTKTAEAFTQIKAVLTAFISKQDTARKMGVDTAKAFSLQNLKSKGLRKTLEELVTSVGGSEIKLQKLLGSTEAVSAVFALTGEKGERFAGIMENMANKAGETNTAYKKIARTTEQMEKIFDSLIGTMSETIGEGFNPIRRAVLSFGITILKIFKSIPQPIKNFITQTAALVFAVILVSGVILALKAAFVLLALVIFSTILAMLPIIAIVGGITAAIGLLILMVKNNVGGIGDFFKDIFNNVSLAFQAIIGIITKGEISEKLFNQLKDAGILGFVETVLSSFFRLKEFMGGVFSTFGEAFETTVGPAFTELKNSILTVIDTFSEFFGSTDKGTDKLGENLTNMTLLGKKIGVVIGGALGLIVKGIVKTINFFVLLFGAATEGIDSLVGGFEGLKETILGVFSSITDNSVVKFILDKAGLTKQMADLNNIPEKPLAGLGGSNFEPIPAGGVGGGALGLNGEEAGITNAADIVASQNRAGAANAGGIADVLTALPGGGEQQINLVTRVMIDEQQIGEAVERVNTKKRTANGGQN